MQTLPKERRYETLSYLPPLSDAQIAKQIQYILNQGYIPAIEFNEISEPTEFYWTLWKLPLFGAKSTQKDAVLNSTAAISVLWVLTTSSSAKYSALSFTNPADTKAGKVN